MAQTARAYLFLPGHVILIKAKNLEIPHCVRNDDNPYERI